MRTEVKAGLIAGLIIIGGAILYFFAAKPGGSGGTQADKIPFDVKQGKGQGVDIVQLPANGRRPAADQGAKAPKPGEKPTTRPSTPPRAGDTVSMPKPAGPTTPAGAADRGTPGTQRPLPPIVGSAGEPRASGPAGPASEPTSRGVAERPAPAPTRESEPLSPLHLGPMLPPTSRAAPTETATTPASEEPSVPRRLGVAVPPRPSEATQPEDRATRIKETPKPEASPAQYTVLEGDRLMTIAREHYGDANLWTRIRDANPGIDPDRLKVGQVIVLPPKEGAVRPTEKKEEPTTGPGRKEDAQGSQTKPNAAPPTYVVERGDSLISIARSLLGDGTRWREIYDLNRDKIKNPDQLFEGLQLRLPPKEKEAVKKEAEAKKEIPKEKPKNGQAKEKEKKPAKPKP